MSYKYVRTIFLGYIFIIFIGAVLLSLPFSHVGELRFIDAFKRMRMLLYTLNIYHTFKK